MIKTTDVVIVGGGLAGLASGIHLSKKGISVMIIEKEKYPRHKVCGEYISSEILPYLKWLDADLSQFSNIKIDKFGFTTVSGKSHVSKLPLGGIGISRYTLDNLLFTTATASGCTFVYDTVKSVTFSNDTFTIDTTSENYTAKTVLGAYGKRSGLDQALSRGFITKKSPWLAVKAHYKGNFPDNMVSLYNFPGGYCGVSKVEDNSINICYLADYKTFKRYKNIEDYQQNILGQNPELKALLNNSEIIFKKPLTISQISFKAKKTVENHILMIGDTAGLIHPLCGNGMAMAIHSAKIASEFLIDFFNENISRQELEKKYAASWKSNFNGRIKMGRILSRILQSSLLTKCIFSSITLFPALLPYIINKTHGKPIPVTA